MPGTTLNDEKLRAMRAFVPGSDSESLSDVERKYYWMKSGGSLPVPPTLDTSYIRRLYWSNGPASLVGLMSSNDQELQFYQSKGVPVGRSLQDSALLYWSTQ